MSEYTGKTVEQVLCEDGRYSPGVAGFLREGLSFTVEKFHPCADGDGPRHVTGGQLCAGLRDLALRRWGLMARYVLKYWNINATRDFGEIVFLLVNNQLMSKQPEDSIEDFDDVFDFDQSFVAGYKFSAGN